MEDIEQTESWLQGLRRLNGAIEAQGQPLVGNLCYGHLETEYLDSPPNAVLRTKRDRFRSAVAARTRMLEVGVNGGHSAYVALTANPELEFHGVDICEHAYVDAAIAQLQADFPGRVFFHRGDCTQVLPRLAAEGRGFDLFHIDGAKFTYLEDVRWCERMIEGDTATLVMDDTDERSVSWVWEICRVLGVVEPTADPEPAENGRNLNQVGTMRTLPGWRRTMFGGVVRAVRIAHRTRNGFRALLRAAANRS